MSENFPEDQIADWLKRARSDLVLGKQALKTKEVLPEDACFHAQQCAEKALKALLVAKGIEFPRTHAIELLLDLLKVHGIIIPENVDFADELSQFAVQTRYPGEWEPVTKNEAKKALERADYVLSWVRGML